MVHTCVLFCFFSLSVLDDEYDVDDVDALE